MPEPGEALSEREKEVLCLVATGASNEQIARELIISANTVKVHLRNIFAKLGVTSRTEASLYAIRQGWVSVETPPTTEGNALAAPTAPAHPVPRWPRWLALAAVAVLVLALTLSLTGLLPVRIFPPASPSSSAISSASIRRWTVHSPMPTPRSNLALAHFRDALYAIGGEGLQGVSGAVERFDIYTDTWTPLASKPTNVADIHAALLGGRIYVPGGRTASGQPTAVTEVYEVATNRWSSAAPLPWPLSDYALVALEGKLYLFGGWDGSRYRAEILRYSPEDNRWEAAGQLPSPCGQLGAVAVDNRILLIGGVDAAGPLNQSLEYSPDLETVQPQPPTDIPLGHVQATILQVELTKYLCVSTDPGSPAAPRIMWHNLRAADWYEFEPSPAGLYSGAAFIGIGTELFLVGGTREGNPLGLTQEFQAFFAATLQPLPQP